MSGVGSPRQIRPRTTTLLTEPNTMEPPNGSSRAAHSRNGSQQDHCYGSMESVCLFGIPIHHFFDDSRTCSWIRKDYSLVRGTASLWPAACSRCQLARL